MPFIAKGAVRILHWATWQHDERTDLFFRLNTLCKHLSGSNLWSLNYLLPLICSRDVCERPSFFSWDSPSYSVTKISQQYKMYCFSWFKDGRSQASLEFALVPLILNYCSVQNFVHCSLWHIQMSCRKSLLPRFSSRLGVYKAWSAWKKYASSLRAQFI